MDLIDKLKNIGDRFEKLKDKVGTEEASKNAFVMPFLAALGYDVFNPLEVVPEFIADIGIKKGEKVDYCIFQDDVPIIIIECKHWKEQLNPHHTQLHRYFHVTKARFAILTNGAKYRFYTDLEADNKMDDKPFLEFNLVNITENIANELKRFQCQVFDADEIISVASDLKYSKEIKELLTVEMKNASEDFVKFFASKVYNGRLTSKVLEQFTMLVNRATQGWINETINARLQTAIQGQKEMATSVIEEVEAVADEEKSKNGIETTEEELKGYRIVQAILAEVLDINRIASRDTKSYFGILLDDNNRRPICRLRFNNNQKYLEVFGEDKKSEKIPIEKVEDIYNYKEHIISGVKLYE
ncbi:MAG: type I restriction endonuclease [Chitinophagales bacterium]